VAIVNELQILHECAPCSDVSIRVAQFSYGLVWQLDYTVGAVLRWGQPSIGDPSESGALVEGWLLPCARCATEGPIDIVVLGGIIVGVAEAGSIERLSNVAFKRYSYRDA